MSSKKSPAPSERKRPAAPTRAVLRPEALFTSDDAPAGPDAPAPLSDERPTEVYEALPGAAGRLVVEAGRHAGEEVRVGAGSAVLGRSSKCALVLKRSAGVSRRHARIGFEGGGFFVEDLESRNGTRLNGRLLTGRTPLSDGDLIEISDERIRFRSASEAPGLHAQETALFEGAAAPPPLPSPPSRAPPSPPPLPAAARRDRPVTLELQVEVESEEAIPLDRPKAPPRPALRRTAPSPAPQVPPLAPADPIGVPVDDTGAARSGALPALGPAWSAPALSPLDMSTDALPRPPRLPEDASPYVHHGPPQRSSRLFLVGGLLGLLLATGLVVGWDLSLNDGQLWKVLAVRAEALLASGAPPTDRPPTDKPDDMSGEDTPDEPAREASRDDVATGDPGDTPAGTLAEAPPEGTGSAAVPARPAEHEGAAGPEQSNPSGPSASSPAGDEAPRPSFTVRSSTSGVVESVRVKVGDRVEPNEVVLSISTASPTLARKLRALRKEERSFERFAAEGNARAQRDLEAVRREIRALEAQRRGNAVRSAAGGRVTAVLVKRGDAVKRGVVVAKVTPE